MVIPRILSPRFWKGEQFNVTWIKQKDLIYEKTQYMIVKDIEDNNTSVTTYYPFDFSFDWL